MERKLARILLVEDHLPLATLRRVFLASQGYDVVCIADGKGACRLLRQQQFDLVLTDSELPKGSGREVAATAKKKNLPVILSSGWPSRMSPEEGAGRCVDFVAPKPCGVERLLSLIETALKKSREA